MVPQVRALRVHGRRGLAREAMLRAGYAAGREWLYTGEHAMGPHTRYVALFAAATLVSMLAALRVLRRVSRLAPRSTAATAAPTTPAATASAATSSTASTAASTAGSAPPTTARDEGVAAAGRMVEVGEVLGVLLIGASVVRNNVRGASLRADVAWTSAFAAAGLAMVLLVGRLGLRSLLRARLPAELARGNVAAGVAAASHLLATGLLASRAVAGHSARELGLALAFFALALVSHGVLVALFRALTTYDDAEQIEGENLAAALSYAGVSVSIAVLVARAVEGDFTGWASSLAGFGGVAAWALLLYPVRQLVVQGLLLGARPSFRGGALDEAVGTRRDVGTAALEAAAYVGTALAVAVVA